MRSIGLDVGRQFAEAAAIEPGGEVHRLGRITASPAGLRAFAAGLGPDDAVVLEATANTWAIAELLAEHAGRVVVSNPLRTRAIAAAKTKTDQIDAATLAQLLAADYLPEVWQPDAATQALRRLVAHRAGLVRGRTGARNRVHAICARRLLSAPVSDLFGVAGRAWLDRLVLEPDERLALDAQMRLLATLEVEIDAAERAIAAHVLDDRRMRHLLTIPGVGLATAASLVAVIGDVGRFPRPHKLVSYLGLDPRVRQSGARPAFTGHISRAGQAHARGLLVEAAHAAVKVPGPLRGFFVRTRSRRGTGVAIVAVARKLTVLAWHLLTDDVDYRWAPAVRSAEKLRRLELLGGASKRFDLRGRREGVKARRTAELVRERVVLEQAEAAYVALVAARRGAHKKDAAATNGERLDGPALSGQGPAARRS